MCESDRYDVFVDVSPHAFSQHRRDNWPTVSAQPGVPPEYVKLYQVVKSTGLPNCMGARIPVPSSLNIEAWRAYTTDSNDDHELIDFLQYGFPIGYLGPVSNTSDIDNHASAVQFPDHVHNFVQEEIDEGAFLGPCTAPPFREWSHTSPIMTRPKADPCKRRVITDLTFPHEHSINAFIMKNSALGHIRAHSLPTITDLVTILRSAPHTAQMFTVDIARAYRNFRSDPLDWPLLCVRWNGAHFIDVSMPFGARASSCHMQRVANFIMSILEREGIKGAMYLDDIIVVAPDGDTARSQYERVTQLLAELGLPEAEHKSQPPSPIVTWLGIDIDAANMTLSIPQQKVHEIVHCVSKVKAAASVHKRQLQSLIGKLMHLAKCVEPARIFMARLLAALRDMGDRWYTKVSDSMKADLMWFEEFAMSWNGRAIITSGPPVRRIQVDACLTGVGATDGRLAYAARVTPDNDPIHNITEIEAANVVIALHTFISAADAGTRVQVQCDNMSTVQAFTHGRAQNPILTECARAVWMVEALFNVKLCFTHLPGTQNGIADALSRAHMSPAYHNLAAEFITSMNLIIIQPCTYVLSFLTPSITTRSGVQLASIPGRGPSGGLEGSGDVEGTPRSRQGARVLRLPLQHGPNADVADGRVRMDRADLGRRGVTRDGQEQDLSSTCLHTSGGGLAARLRPHQSIQGAGRGAQNERASSNKEGASPPLAPEGCHRSAAHRPQRSDGQGGIAPDIFRCPSAVGGRPLHHGHIRPRSPSHKGRHIGARPTQGGYQVGQKPTELQSVKSSHTEQNWGPPYMSGGGPGVGTSGEPTDIANGTTVCLQRLTPPGSDFSHKGGVDSKNQRAWGGPHRVHTSQLEEGVRHDGIRGRLHRAGGPAARGLEVLSIQDLYRDRCPKEDLKSTDRLS